MRRAPLRAQSHQASRVGVNPARDGCWAALLHFSPRSSWFRSWDSAHVPNRSNDELRLIALDEVSTLFREAKLPLGRPLRADISSRSAGHRVPKSNDSPG